MGLASPAREEMRWVGKDVLAPSGGVKDRGPRAGRDASVPLDDGCRRLRRGGEGSRGNDVIFGRDEEGGGFRNAPAQGSAHPQPTGEWRSRGADGDGLVTAPATRGGDVQAKASGRWAEVRGRVFRLRMRRTQRRACCPARTLTRGRPPGRTTSPAAATPTCCAKRTLTVQGGGGGVRVEEGPSRNSGSGSSL